MSRQTDIRVVKTAQISDTLKLTLDGSVVGSIVSVGEGHELRDGRDKVIGTYSGTDTAIAAFRDWIDTEPQDVGL